jgi:hypothetical protein
VKNWCRQVKPAETLTRNRKTAEIVKPVEVGPATGTGRDDWKRSTVLLSIGSPPNQSPATAAANNAPNLIEPRISKSCDPR